MNLKCHGERSREADGETVSDCRDVSVESDLGAWECKILHPERRVVAA